MKSRIPAIVLLTVFSWTTNLHAQQQDSPFLGGWAFTLPDERPAWLKVVRLDHGQVQASFLWSVGSARLVKNPKIENGRFTFERAIKWKPFGGKIQKRITSPFTATMTGDGKLKLSAEAITVGGEDAKPEPIVILGTRISPTPPRPDLTKVKFGKPVSLFNGKDLSGWKLSDPNKKNGWRAVSGVLQNETPKQDFSAYGVFGNLMTKERFHDFELTIEYNVPAGGNSGVYLRGMYEAQVVDRDSRMQGIQGPGAIFGRITPTRNAGKAGGEWNKYVLTLVDRHVTIVLNGEKVVGNARLEGCTGGGLQANDDLPGPIFLQGDHTSISYRNIVLRPVIKAAKPHPKAVPNKHAQGDVDKPELVPYIVPDVSELPGVVVDESEAELVGRWQYSTHTPPYVGVGYLHDQKDGKGEKSVTYTPQLPRTGEYEVRVSHCYNVRRSTNTPVTVHHAKGETLVRINQQETPPFDRLFRSIGRYRFRAGTDGWVKISTQDTDGKYVIADAVQFIPMNP